MTPPTNAAPSRRPRVYDDPRSLDLDGPSAVLHAKAVVTDELDVPTIRTLIELALLSPLPAA